MLGPLMIDEGNVGPGVRFSFRRGAGSLGLWARAALRLVEILTRAEKRQNRLAVESGALLAFRHDQRTPDQQRVGQHGFDQSGLAEAFRIDLAGLYAWRGGVEPGQQRRIAKKAAQPGFGPGLGQ